MKDTFAVDLNGVVAVVTGASRGAGNSRCGAGRRCSTPVRAGTFSPAGLEHRS
jgi:hypothetical protein